MERVLRAGFLLLVAAAPLWYGGTNPAAQAGNGIAAGLLAAAVLWLGNISSPFGNAPRRSALTIAGLFAAVVLWVLLQALPGTPGLSQHALWATAGEGIGGATVPGLSLDRQASLTALARLLTVATVFAIAVHLAHSGEGARRIVQGTVAAGALYAAYSLADLVFDWRTILFRPKNPYTIAQYGNYATGPFINSTHFAAYCGIALMAATALIVAGLGRLSEGGHQSLKRTVSIGVHELLRPGLLLAFAFLLLAIGIATSTSRMAPFTVLAGLLSLLVIQTIRSRRWIASGLVMLAVVGVFAILIDSIAGIAAERSSTLAGALDSRLAVYRLTGSAIADAPLTGYGYGTFERIFPLYRDASAGIGGVWNAAHNTYLELAVTLGVPAALVLVGIVAWLGLSCAIGAVKRRRHAAAPLAAAGATVALGLHSLVDFPLQTDAVAIAYAALLGAGVAQAWPSGRQARTRAPVRQPGRGAQGSVLGELVAGPLRPAAAGAAIGRAGSRLATADAGASRPKSKS